MVEVSAGEVARRKGKERRPMLILKMTSLCTLFAGALLAFHGSADARVRGYVDTVKSGTISGWACDSPNTRSIKVHLYVGGPAGSGKAIKSITANVASTTTKDRKAIAAACGHTGRNGAHRFRWTIPDSVMSAHGGKKIYVHGIDLSGSPNLLLNNSGSFKVPPLLRGRLTSLNNGVAKGWACAERSANSVKVQAYAGSNLVGTFTTTKQGSTSVDRTCRHAGRGRHHFEVTAPMGHAGKKLRLRVISPSNGAPRTLIGSDRYFMPGDAKHLASLARYVWDYSLTNHCSKIKATVLSLPGADGTTHGPAREHFDRLAKAVGKHCVRLIKVNVNPGDNANNKLKGYWDNHTSYKVAGAFVSNILYRAESKLKGNDGRRFTQGKTIYIGSSAGAHIGGAALEWNARAGRDLPSFNSLVDRSILVSGPLFADLSVGCSLLTSDGLRERLDDIFRLNGKCSNSPRSIGAQWDVANPNSSHSYLDDSAKQISVLVGKSDTIGCQNLETDPNKPARFDCGSWSPVDGMQAYIDALGGGFSNRGVASSSAPHTYQEISGNHELWNYSIVRRLACKNILTEVAVRQTDINAVCNSL